VGALEEARCLMAHLGMKVLMKKLFYDTLA